jgi:hypothetical protein
MTVKSNYGTLTLEEAWLTPNEVIELDFEYLMHELGNGEEPTQHEPDIEVTCKRRFIEHDDGTYEVIEHKTSLQHFEFPAKIQDKLEELALEHYHNLENEEY